MLSVSPGRSGDPTGGEHGQTEPVSADGQFVIDKTLVELPAFGGPVTLALHYRSGADAAATARLPLGEGWSHSFNARVIDINAGSPCANWEGVRPVLETATMERIAFVFTRLAAGVEYYHAPESPTLRLTRQQQVGPFPADWRLDDGSGNVQVFAGGTHGGLQWIEGHGGIGLVYVDWGVEEIAWQQYIVADGPRIEKRYYVNRVDIPGVTSLYFNYLPGSHALKCISPIADRCDPADKPFASFGYDNGLLTTIIDRAQKRTTFEYANYPGTSSGPYIRDAELDAYCKESCSSPNTPETCRSIDACSGLGRYYVNYICQLIPKPDHNDAWRSALLFYSFCAHEAAQFDPFAGDELWCNTMTPKAFCFYAENRQFDVCRTAPNQQFAYSEAEMDEAWNLALTYREWCKALRSVPATAFANACRPQCEADCLGDLGAKVQGIRKHAFGHPDAARNNIIAVRNDEGLVVANTYFDDPLAFEFDRVQRHQMGPSAFDAVTFSYHDLDIEQQDLEGTAPPEGHPRGVSHPDPLHVDPRSNFHGMELCPRGCTNTDDPESCPEGFHYTAARPWDPSQRPRYAVVAMGLRNAVSTRYFDPAWRLLRDVSHATGEQTDYNYHSAHGMIIGVKDAKGARECLEYTAGDRKFLTRSVGLPSPHYERADPRDLRYAYDTEGLLERIVRVATSPGQVEERTEIGRDWQGRIAAIVRYPQPGQPLPWIYTYSAPCAPQFALASCLEPIEILRPDGSRISIPSRRPEGPDSVDITTANGIVLQHTEFTYEGWRKVTERVTIGPHAGEERRLAWDDMLRPWKLNLLDATDSTKWVESIYGYDTAGHVVSARTPPRLSRYTVDTFGHVTVVEEEATPGEPVATASRKSCQAWTIDGLLLGEVDAEGHVTTYEYDMGDRLKRVIRGGAVAPGTSASCTPQNAPAVVIASYHYDGRGVLAWATEDGVTTTVLSDGFGRPVERTRTADGVKKTIQQTGYDSADHVTWQAVRDETSPGYQRPVGIDPSLHAMQTMAFDGLGRLSSEVTWRFHRHPLAADPGGLLAETRYLFDDVQREVRIEGDGVVARVEKRDELGRRLRTTLAPGTADESHTDYNYFLPGVVTSVTTPGLDTLRRVRHDWAGRPRTIEDGGRTIETLDYDRHGRVVSKLSLGGRLESWSYDAYDREVGRVVTFDANQSYAEATAWYATDQLKQRVDGAGQTTAWTYDALGRLGSEISGLGKTTYAYEGPPLSPSRVEGAGRRTEIDYLFDGAIREVRLAAEIGGGWGPTSTRRFEYSPLGSVVRAELVGRNIVQRELDSLGRTTREANDRIDYTVTHSYGIDPANRPFDTLTLLDSVPAAAASFRREVDDLGRLTRLTDLLDNNRVIDQLGYGAGLLQTETYGNGVQTTYAYDAHAQPVRVEALTTGVFAVPGSLITRERLARAADGRMRARIRTLGPTSPERLDAFELDFDGRLIKERHGIDTPLPAGEIGVQTLSNLFGEELVLSTSYSLDGAHNWTAKSAASTLFLQPGAANRYTHIGDQNVLSDNVIHDPAGNTKSLDGVAFAYHASGALKDVGNNVSYDVDAFGRRIFESVAGEITQVVWDGSDVLAFIPVVNPGTGIVRVQLGDDASVALQHVAAGGRVYLHRALDQSIIGASDDTGALVEGYRYTGYGETSIIAPDGAVRVSSTVGNRFFFQGQALDLATGLYSMRLRDYHPKIGRFLTPDPIGTAGGLNRYAFVEAKPTWRWDPFGLEGRVLGDRSAVLRSAEAFFDLRHPPFPFALSRSAQGMIGESAGAPRLQRYMAGALVLGASALLVGESMVGGLYEAARNAVKDSHVQSELAGRGLYVESRDPLTGYLMLGTPYGHSARIDLVMTAGALSPSPGGALLARAGSEEIVAARLAARGGAAARADVVAAEVVGRRGAPIEIQPGRNVAGSVGGRDYTSHAFDRMQGRGQTPSVIENTIQTGRISPGTSPGTTRYFDPVNGTTTVVDTSTGRVVTVY